MHIQWYNPVKQSRYFVFLFKTDIFSGTLQDSPEGKIKWMTLSEMLAGPLAPNITKYLAVDDLLERLKGFHRTFGHNGNWQQMVG